MSQHRTIEQERLVNPNRFKYKVYFKSGGASIVLLDKLTYFAALHRAKCLTQMYDGWKGHFIVSV